MSKLGASRGTGGCAFAAMLLSLLLGVAHAAPAADLASGNTDASVAVPPPSVPPTVRVSPHARAAQQRAAAQAAGQAQTGQSGARASAFSTNRKPHNHLAGAR